MAEPRVRVGKHGFNGRMFTNGMGRRDVRVIELLFGLGIIASEGEAKSRKAFYPVVTTSSSFQMVVGFKSWGEREQFNRWMRRFMGRVATGRGVNGVMRIEVPGRRFSRDAIPKGPLEYGEGVRDVGYTLTLSFTGASDTVDLDLGARTAGASYFRMPQNNRVSRYFYPASRQLSGPASLEGTIFDRTSGSGPVGGGGGGQQEDDGPTRYDHLEYQNARRTGAVAAGVSFDEWMRRRR